MSEPAAKVSGEIDKLNRFLSAYIPAFIRSGAVRTVAMAISKQSQELDRNLVKESKGLMPAKGAVRSERIAALKAGEGVHVRASVYREIAEKYGLATTLGGRRVMARGQKRVRLVRTVGGLNFQALAVKRELAVRESGRGFLAHSQRFDMSRGQVNASRRIESSISRLGPQLGAFAFTANQQGGSAVFKWGGFSQLSDEAVKAMGRSRGQAAIARAVAATTDNMIPYLESKLGEAAVQMLKQ